MMGLTLASIYLIPQRIMMWSEGVSVFTEAPTKKEMLKKIFTHPCIIACEIGIVLMLTGWRPPHFLEETITSVSNCNTAMSMLVIGMILADADPKTIIDKDVLFYTYIRLLIIPFCVFIPCWLLHIDSLVMGVSVILAAMPAGATTTILASKYDCEEEFSVKLVVFINARCFQNDERIRRLCEEIKYMEIKGLFIENSEKTCVEGMERYIIDKDKCEIY